MFRIEVYHAVISERDGVWPRARSQVCITLDDEDWLLKVLPKE